MLKGSDASFPPGAGERGRRLRSRPLPAAAAPTVVVSCHLVVSGESGRCCRAGFAQEGVNAVDRPGVKKGLSVRGLGQAIFLLNESLALMRPLGLQRCQVRINL